MTAGFCKSDNSCSTRTFTCSARARQERVARSRVFNHISVVVLFGVVMAVCMIDLHRLDYENITTYEVGFRVSFKANLLSCSPIP